VNPACGSGALLNEIMQAPAGMWGRQRNLLMR
jgi:hypothetical protein